MKADKRDWHIGKYQPAGREEPRPINETYLEMTRKKRTEELEMW